MRNSTMRRRIQAGFTLLEVLISLVVFSIGALGVLAMITLTMSLNQNSRQYTEAGQLAIRQMERLQVLSVASPEFASCPLTTRCYLQVNGSAPTQTLSVVTTEKTMQPASLMGGDAGSKFFYEVTWRVNSGAPRYLEVVVYWPKNRELAGGDWSGAGLNCPGTNNCYSAQYFGYR